MKEAARTAGMMQRMVTFSLIFFALHHTLWQNHWSNFIN
jgi:hypothetical protein